MTPPAAKTQRADCCVVGAGPAGVLLSLILSRLGISVALVEAQGDFDRDFRGDAIFPWVLETLNELGLADRVLEMARSKVRGYIYDTSQGESLVTDYGRLRSPYNFVTVIPQSELLDLLVSQAPQSHFQVFMGTSVQELIEEGGAVRGVRCRTRDGTTEIRATLTVGADGRFSRVRKLGGFDEVATWPTRFDVLWFRLPRHPKDDLSINQKTRFGHGYYVSFIDRGSDWQVSYSLPKGSYPSMRASGLEAFRKSVTALEPRFSARMEEIDWSQVRFLPVEMGRVRQWYRNGLLLIGDAAHVMSSIGGVGITCAMQDAVVAANVLEEPLRSGRVAVADLARVQRQRDLCTRAMQFLQHVVERQYVTRVFDSEKSFRTPPLFRLPGMSRLTAYVTAYGVWPVRLRHADGPRSGGDELNP
jgi:2-polyprenyl-6-methoxyphenol hydroxylase-like FAD-dependent oxidoreductase